jgi:hypothetical protein
MTDISAMRFSARTSRTDTSGPRGRGAGGRGGGGRGGRSAAEGGTAPVGGPGARRRDMVVTSGWFAAGEGCCRSVASSSRLPRRWRGGY